MKKPILSVFLASLLLVPAVHGATAAETSSKNKGDTIIAEVNGSKLTIADFQAYIKMRMSREKKPHRLDQAQRQKIFDEYINRELLYQEAVKKGLDNNALIKAEIENQRRNIVVGYTLQQLMRTPPSESDMQAVYKEIAVPGKEYKSRHILVKTEEQAKQIIARLDKGENFINLAKQHSIDASAKKGGELGWFSANQMVAPFSEAAQKLSNGSYTRTPVKTRFGWHIIRLDGVRETSPPSYDEMKPRLKAMINNRRISNYIASLRKKADVSFANANQSDDESATTASNH